MGFRKYEREARENGDGYGEKTNSQQYLRRRKLVMSDLSNLFSAFYSQFVLRDFFGKIIPGFLLILSIAVSLTSSKETDKYLEAMSGWMWLMTGGVSWIGGFLVQSFGEACGFFRAFPKNS